MELERVAKNGEKHGLINKLANSVQAADAFKNMTPENKAKAEKLQSQGKKLVKARYLNSRGQNERLTMPFTHGAGNPIEQWHFIPGEEYDVWAALVEQVNKSPGLPRRSEVVDVSGRPTLKDGAHEKLHTFVPVSF